MSALTPLLPQAQPSQPAPISIMVSPSSDGTPTARAALRARLEDEIRTGLEEIERGFAKVAEALRQVRELELYKTTHATFEDYCREVWGKSGRWARYRIAGLPVFHLLTDMFGGTAVPVPDAEAQIRPLAGLTPEAQAQAWAEAVAASGGQRPTQAAVERKARQERARSLVQQSKYAVVVQKMSLGTLTPERALGLVTALDQCQPSIRPAILSLGVTDPSVILEINRLGRERRESYDILVNSRALQFADETHVPVAMATAAQLRAWLDERSREHRLAGMQTGAEPVSVIVYPADAQATLRELRRVMTPEQVEMLKEAIEDGE